MVDPSLIVGTVAWEAARADEAEAEIERLRAVLKDVEWVETRYGATCPCCFKSRLVGRHADTCKLAVLLTSVCGASEPKPYGCTPDHCVFSRRMDQEYPRKCIKCGATEQTSISNPDNPEPAEGG